MLPVVRETAWLPLFQWVVFAVIGIGMVGGALVVTERLCPESDKSATWTAPPQAGH